MLRLSSRSRHPPRQGWARMGQPDSKQFINYTQWRRHNFMIYCDAHRPIASKTRFKRSLKSMNKETYESHWSLESYWNKLVHINFKSQKRCLVILLWIYDYGTYYWSFLTFTCALHVRRYILEFLYTSTMSSSPPVKRLYSLSLSNVCTYMVFAGFFLCTNVRFMLLFYVHTCLFCIIMLIVLF